VPATARSNGDSLEIRVLGSLEVVRGGQLRPLPASRKTRALLAYLALAMRPCRREDLCELLWENAVDPRSELRWSLSKLRPALGPWLVASQDSIAIAGTGLTIDATVFRRHAGPNPSERKAREALQLWRDTPLADADVPGSHRYHTWWLMEREALTEIHGRLHHALVDRVWSSPHDALAAARNLTVQHPHDEWGHARVAQALKRAGRIADACAYVEAIEGWPSSSRSSTINRTNHGRWHWQPGATRSAVYTTGPSIRTPTTVTPSGTLHWPLAWVRTIPIV
jgi:DNA-binding SARP family transcriptional activator